MLDEIKPSELAAVRLNQARGCLKSAEMEITAGTVDSFKAAANRSYYCIFHAIRAVLALERFDSKRHSGVISRFRENYVKHGIFPATLSNIIKNAFIVRNDCDYEDYYVISKRDVAAQIEDAKVFLATVEEYLLRTVPEIASINIEEALQLNQEEQLP